MRIWRPSLGVVLVRQRVDSGLLAEAMRAGVRDVVDERNISGLHDAVRRSQGLAAAMREQVAAAAAAAGGREGRIVTVFSAKGGCGKTTLATNMAAALADSGRREVCLVDLDLAFGDVAIALQLFPAHTIADAVPLGDNVDFGGGAGAAHPALPRPDHAGGPGGARHRRGHPRRRWSRASSQVLRDHFDYVIVDTPAGVRRPRAVGVRPVRRRRADRDARHPGPEEPQAHARDDGPAELPARPAGASCSTAPTRKVGPRDRRGREEPAGHDLGADPELPRRARRDQPRRADRARRPPPPREHGDQAVRRAARASRRRRPATGRTRASVEARAERRGLLRRRSRA